jgi:peptidoglycan/LPS O-acetylase OafA/YrhL
MADPERRPCRRMPRPFIGSYEPAALGPNLLLVQALGFFPYHGWNTPSWSISVEFYTLPRLRRAVPCRTAADRAGGIDDGSLGLIALLLWSTAISRGLYDFGLFRCLYGFFWGSRPVPHTGCGPEAA